MEKSSNSKQSADRGVVTATVVSKHRLKRVVRATPRVAKKTLRASAHGARRGAHHVVRGARVVHHHVAKRPHEYALGKWGWYRTWHQWRWHKLVHYGVLSVYILMIVVMLFSVVRVALAADLNNNWDFSTPSDYTLDSGAEISGLSARLKAQEYTADSDTKALYHLNESSGTSLTDSSANSNNATTVNTPSFSTGNMNNGLNLNGTTQYASAPNSSSLALSGQQTIEGWVKPSTTFNSSSNKNLPIVDKGSYKLGLDRSSGKVAYEVQSNSDQWTKRLGDEQSGSWNFSHYGVHSMVNYGTDTYVGLGYATGDGEVWKYNGTTWSKIAGDGINASWPDQIYEQVSALAVNGTSLYAGLASNSGDGEVWQCDLSTGCSAWSKIGGDGVGMVVGTASIQSMVVHAGSLYVGTGISNGYGDVYKYNGGVSWTQIGGDALNSSWAVGLYEGVFSLESDGTNLYAGTGTTAGDAEVWRWNGTAWTQIGGDALNSSWAVSTYETVRTLDYFGGNLYAGLGDGGNDGLVWRWNGTAWTQIGGGGVNSSWSSGSITRVVSMTNDGTNLYAGLGNGSSTGQVWRWNGTAWTLIGGGGAANSFGGTNVDAMVYANGALIAGPYAQSTTQGASVYQYSGSGTTWTQIGGSGVNNSWLIPGLFSVSSSTVVNGKYYVGLYGNAGSANVYEYDGTTATRIGGGGINSSWAANTYETVSSMIGYGGSLYVGLGSSSGDAELWKWSGSTWTKVAGDSVNASWGSTNDAVSSMAVYGGSLYVGLGVVQLAGSDVWKFNGSTWSQIGGDSLNGSWSTSARDVPAMTVFNNQLCASTGAVNPAANAGTVWCWNDSTWTQIGGQSLNGSWAGTVTDSINSLVVYNDQMYAGMSDTTNTSSAVWRWNGTAWTQIGGGSISSSWADGSYTRMHSMAVYNGELYVGTGTGTLAGTGDVWRYNGSSWSQIGGDGINSSWANGLAEQVTTMAVYKGKLYAGTGLSPNVDPIVYSFGNNAYLESTASSFDNSWHHLAATYDGVTMKLYVDGSLDASSDVSATRTSNSLPLLIGRSYGTTRAGSSQDFFEGSLDEIRISSTARTSLTSQPYANTHQGVVLTDAILKTGVESWDSFASSETLNGGAATFRLSDDDKATWKYWDGDSWEVSSSLAQSNTSAVISAQISTFPTTFDGITWQAVLKGDGNQQVTLNSVQLAANSDSIEPDQNASLITAAKVNGGAALSSNQWTNGGSPSFAWTAGTDAGSGILGYCLYLGQTSSADPQTSKGLLGTGSLDTGSSCPFAVATTELNLATPGLLSTALSSSDSPYYLNIKAIDQAGNIAGSSEQFQFRFDNTAPINPGFISAPSGFINTKTATLTWPTTGGQAASDANSGLAGLQYKIGSSIWYGDDHIGSGDADDLLANDGTYTTVDPPDFDNIVDGNNTVSFRTWDQAGNVTTSYTSAVIRVNTSGAPSEPRSLTATPSTNTTNNFAFSWDAPADFNTTTGSDDKLVYCYTVNTLPNANNCSFTAAGITSIPSGPFATQPGQNTLYVVAKDDFNIINYSSYGSVTFTANTAAPGIPVNPDIVDVSVKTSSNWRLAITWDEPTSLGAGVSTYKILRSTDNVTFTQAGTSTSTSYVDGGLSQITYYYRIKACDSANNCGSESTTLSKLPTGKYTSPATSTSEPVVSGVTTKRATIDWSTDRISDSKVQIGTASGDYSPSEIGNSSQVTAHRIDLDNLAAGTTYYFKAKWTDEDGNTGSSQEYTFKTSPAPLLKEVNPLSVGLSNATIQFSTKDAVKADINFGKSDSFGGVKSINTSASDSTYELDLAGLDDGVKYFYKITLYDSEGGSYPSSIFSFTTPPRPRISNVRFQPVKDQPTSTQEVTWTTNVATNSSVSFGKTGTTGTSIQAQELKTEHSITLKGLEDDSEYFLIAEGRDANGNFAASDRQVFKTALDTRPPLISNVTIEASVRGTGLEARGQIVVSWNTDEPSTSQVAYAEGSATKVFNNRTAEDGQLTTEHLVIVSDLPTSKVYSIMPVSNDRSKNTSSATQQAAIIGRASDNVLNLVVNTLKKVFGL